MLRAREAQVLRFLREYRDEYEIMPTLREVMAGCQIVSTCTAGYAIDGLVRKGYLDRYAGRARGLRLTALGRAATAAGDGAEKGQP